MVPANRRLSTSAVFFQPPPQITEKMRLTRGFRALFGADPAEKAHSNVFFQAETEGTGKSTSESVPGETGSQGQRKSCMKLGQEPASDPCASRMRSPPEAGPSLATLEEGKGTHLMKLEHVRENTSTPEAFMTLSILGRCADRKLIGAALVSGDPFVGAYGVHFASGHVCVAQAQSGPAQAQALLREITAGRPAKAAVQAVSSLHEAERWQIGCLGAQGEGVAVTGKKVFPVAACRIGAEHVALGNTLLTDVVLEATSCAFVSSAGSLASRLIAGLTGGVSAGGDKRGHRSARLLVWTHGGQVVNDIRIDDHGDPVSELQRLHVLTCSESRGRFCGWSRIPVSEGGLGV
jgi:uncharacterized Ntn-hydrolase superfamily protein